MDREFAFGNLTTFFANTQSGLPLPAGESFSYDVSLDPGDYVGLFQFNLENTSLSASVKSGNDTLISTSNLAPSNATTGQSSLYWYSPGAADLTLEFENTSSTDLGLFSPSYVTGSADHVDGINGNLVQFSYSGELLRAHRHYITLDVSYDDLLDVQLTGAGSANLTLTDSTLNPVASGTNGFAFIASPGDYLLAIEATQPFPNGFAITFQETTIIEINETSSPNLAIPDNNSTGVSDTITIGNCPTITAINMDINITHTWRGDLAVDLTSPDGTNRTLKARFGSSTSNIIGNFNQTLNPESGFSADTTAEPITDFEGISGTGNWTLRVRDLSSGDTGTLNSWGLNLTCED